MKQLHIIIFILCFFSKSIFAQETGLLTGTVFDKEAMSFAKVTVSQNGKIITDVFADFEGKYKIPLQEGVYIVHASQVGLVSKKIKIEIKANETTTLDFQLFVARYDFVAVLDTIKINAFEVNKIDEKLKVAIDNHIKTAHKKLFFPNKKRNNINVYISDRNYSDYELEYIDINEVRSKHKQFKESKFCEGYNISISFFRKSNRGTGLGNCTKLFYYKYNNWDIFLGTQIDDLEFPFVDGLKNFEFQIKYKDIESNINGKYGWKHKKVHSYFANEGRLPGKRHENYYTNYYITDHDVTFRVIKNKCLFKDY